MIVVSAVEASRTYLPLLLAYALSQSQLKGSVGVGVTIAFWCYSCVCVYSVFAHWATRLFAFDDEGIRHRQGLFSKTEVFLPWSSVVAIEVHRDPVRDMAGCCKVVVRASSGADSGMTLDVVSRALVDAIQHVSGLPVSQDRERDADLDSFRDGKAEEEPIFTASHRDLIVMSFAYGRFALFVPFVAGTYLELADMVKLPDPEWIVARGLSGTLPIQLPWLGGFALISVAYGYVVTLLRFWRFRASIAGSSLLLEGGLLTSQRRTIPLDGVTGVVLHRNVFELLTGRGRLALLTRDADQALGKNVVLPALKMSEIEARVDALGGRARQLLVLDRAPLSAGKVWWIAGARVSFTISVVAIVLAVSDLWRYYAAASAVIVPLCLLIVNACFAVLAWDESGEGILYRRGVMWRSSFSLPLAEVHVFKTETQPWDRWMGLQRQTLYYFSGGTRKLFAWQPSAGRSVGLAAQNADSAKAEPLLARVDSFIDSCRMARKESD